MIPYLISYIFDTNSHCSPKKSAIYSQKQDFKDTFWKFRNSDPLPPEFWTYSIKELGFFMASLRSMKLLSIRSSPGQSRGIFLLCLFQLLLKVKERQTNVTGRLFIRASCFSTSTIMAIMSTRPLEWDSLSLHLAEWGVAVLKLQLLRTQIRVGTWIAVLPLEYWGHTAFRKWPNCKIRLIVAKI